MINFEELRAQVTAVDSGKAERRYWTLAHEIEDALLYLNEMPEAAFSLFADVFSDERLASRKGICHFANVLQSDFGKLSPDQAKRLLAVFLSNNSKYQDELARHCIADLVARRYPEGEALRFFQSLTGWHTAEARHMCFVGCDVLMRRDAVSGTVKDAARKLMASLTA